MRNIASALNILEGIIFINMKRLLILFGFMPIILLSNFLPSPDRVVGAFVEHSHNQAALDIIQQVNLLRLANNVPAYRINPILMSIAQTHSEYLASTGIVTHFSASGARPYQRAVSAGYSVFGDLSLGGMFSENIQSGSDLSPSEVVAGWQTDLSNLNTMISSELRDVGAGVSFSNGLTYFVLDAGVSTDQSGRVATNTIVAIVNEMTTTPATSINISTPLISGEIYHNVRQNETLSIIADTYNTTVEQIKLFNGLNTDEIFAGQTLLIQRVNTQTPTQLVLISATFGIPTSTATPPIKSTLTATPTPLPISAVSRQGGILTVGIIVLIAAIAASVGALWGREKIN